MSFIRSGNPNSSSVSAGRVRCCSRCCRCARARVEAGSLLFHRVFLPTSLRSSSSSHTHSSTVVDMGKGPVFYSEIGKKARDLLSKDYTYDHKFVIATTTQSGLVSQTDRRPESQTAGNCSSICK
jgi:hypothetical protein